MNRKTLLIGGAALALLILALGALGISEGLIRSAPAAARPAAAPAAVPAGTAAAAEPGQGAAQPAAPAAPPAAATGSWNPGITDFDHVLGAADAPVTMLEYASLTCGHCAAFDTETLPQLKQRYIDTGQMRLVYRDFPLDGLALRASMLARCAPPEQFFNVINVLFANQRQWATASDPLKALGQIGRMAGIGEEAFTACMEDRALADRILQGRLQAEQQYQIDATPTFIINGEKLSGNHPVETFAAVIDRYARSQ